MVKDILAIVSAFDRGRKAFENYQRLRDNPFDWGAWNDGFGYHVHTAWNDGWLERQREMCAAGQRSMAG